MPRQPLQPMLRLCCTNCAASHVCYKADVAHLCKQLSPPQLIGADACGQRASALLTVCVPLQHAHCQVPLGPRLPVVLHRTPG